MPRRWRGWGRSPASSGRSRDALDAYRRSLARDPLLVDALIGGAARCGSRPAPATSRRSGWRAPSGWRRVMPASTSSSAGSRQEAAREVGRRRGRGAAAIAALTAACGGGPPASAPRVRRRAGPVVRRRGRQSRDHAGASLGTRGLDLSPPRDHGRRRSALRHGRRRRPRRAAGAERRARRARPRPPASALPQRRQRPLRGRHGRQRRRRAGLRHGCGYRRLRRRRRSRSCISPISAATSCSGTTDRGASPTSLRRRGSPDPAGARARPSSTSTPTAGSTSSSPGISPGRPSASVSASA